MRIHHRPGATDDPSWPLYRHLPHSWWDAVSIADGEFSNHDQYIHAIRSAREYIYLENQAISVRPILEELVAAVNRGVAVVMVLPMVAGEPFRNERCALAHSPHFTLAGLAGRDADGTRHPVHVHAKLMIVDDVWATAGSCNLHRYSMYGNSELNVAFADVVTVRALRCELLAEHLGQDTAALDGRSALQVFRAVAYRERRSSARWKCRLGRNRLRAGSAPVVGGLNGVIVHRRKAQIIRRNRS